MPPQTDSHALETYLPSTSRDALAHLELFARHVVEGMLHGTHRSRRKGVSTEFDHHTLYQPGDPLKHIDWKVSARQDRYYVKRYIEDTSLGVRIVLDRSASMRMQTEGPTKYLQAARLAAALAYLVIRNRDAVGLTVSAAGGTDWLPPRSTENHLVRVLQMLAATPPDGEDNLATTLAALLDRSERRGLLVAISDLMFDPAPVQAQLGRLQAQGHEVLLFQLRDPTEEDFPFNRWADFRDLEGALTAHRLDAVPLKKIYREEYQALLDDWRNWARKRDVHFVTLRTDESVEAALVEYMHRRGEVLGR